MEKLKNCPNCAGYLDDSGRCNFCGSKVYDFCNIDVTNNRGKNYIRLKTNNQIIIAPVFAEYATITTTTQSENITLDVSFVVAGDVIIEEA